MFSFLWPHEWVACLICDAAQAFQRDIHITIVEKEMMIEKLRNYVADNKMPQQMAFHGVVCCLHKYQIVICLWHVRQLTNTPQA